VFGARAHNWRPPLKKKVLLHGEFQDGKAFDVESIYQFALVEHASDLPKIGAITDFVDSATFAGIGGGE